MKELLNTLYVTTQRSWLSLDHDTVKVKIESETKMQVPLLHLGSIFCFGDVGLSTPLLHRCAEDGRAVVLLNQSGRFMGRLSGAVSGNVLLRRAQHLALSDPLAPAKIARQIVAAKIQNSRQILLRGARESPADDDAIPLRYAAERLALPLPALETESDLDRIRGFEGEAARTYFEAFGRLVREDRETFKLDGRSRRPPQDPLNALLSFLYALVRSDCVSAIEGVGLDPQVGYLHTLRPGRPALALDLMEELRSILADRLALTLVNRKQIGPSDFVAREGGAVHLTDAGRKSVLVAYQKRKQDEVQHPVLAQSTPLGLVPHVQARLLAHHLRNELEVYPPFLYR